jgi:hypothetical protein
MYIEHYIFVNSQINNIQFTHILVFEIRNYMLEDDP